MSGANHNRQGNPILRTEGLLKTFGGITAVDDVSLALNHGTITGLIGPNGAGKSTLIDLLSGFYSPDDGRIIYDAQDITNHPPYGRVRCGLTRTFQITREWRGMTVIDNMLAAGQNQPGEKVTNALLQSGAVVDRERELTSTADAWLRDLDLGDHRDEYAGTLSGGQQKLLELGRVLMTDADLLLLDEPFAGVNPVLTEKLSSVISDLRAEGMTFLIVEHDLETIIDISDRLVVLKNGEVIADDEPEVVIGKEIVSDALTGGIG